MKSKFIFCVIVVLLATSVDAKKRPKDSHRHSSEMKEPLLEKSGNMTKLSDDAKSQLEECTGSTELADKLEEISNDQNSTQLTGESLGKAIDAVPQGGDLEEDLLASLTSCFLEARKETRSKQVEKFTECAAEESVDDCESELSPSESSRQKKRPNRRRPKQRRRGK